MSEFRPWISRVPVTVVVVVVVTSLPLYLAIGAFVGGLEAARDWYDDLRYFWRNRKARNE